ncbi:hypothetical protein PSTAB_3389 [Stutzerimonas stutzeri]|uniref:Uncharacterized protein n=1 Tax=Stutzerimonas stutzeri (strain ATCC 17588 / DSM 5190 / CCUG 11256 / JCM 5965 / LMG 11199 / NBRC 14165 / NCIMB 11358 / Stanier 221) TaxID=96563 RepID=F8GZM6_STUS2|nr:hypothetical protein [Stutzerimonas stutzeri]AEJ06670.1 hypothetical protein PSTAB_3389 [Stutzerimonas stutzeri]
MTVESAGGILVASAFCDRLVVSLMSESFLKMQKGRTDGGLY